MEIDFFGDGLVADVVELQQFSVGEVLRGFGDDFHQSCLACFRGTKQGVCEDEIADQHGHLVAESCIHRFLSAPFPTLVHNIVVDETGCVEELEGGGCVDGVFADGPSCQLGSENREHGTHHLPASAADVAQDRIEQGVGVLKEGLEHLFVSGHFGINWLSYL